MGLSNFKTTIFIAVLVIIFSLFVIQKFLHIPFAVGDPTAIHSAINKYGIFAPFVFIFIYTVSCFTPFPKAPLTIAGGILFGVTRGVLYTVIGATLGATLAFLLSRYFGAEGVCALEESKLKQIAQFDSKLAEHGFIAVLLLRLIPLFPFTGLNFALGLTRVKFRDYVIATAIGIAPAAIFYALFGESLLSFRQTYIYLAPPILIIVVFWILARRYYKKSRN